MVIRISMEVLLETKFFARSSSRKISGRKNGHSGSFFLRGEYYVYTAVYGTAKENILGGRNPFYGYRIVFRVGDMDEC